MTVYVDIEGRHDRSAGHDRAHPRAEAKGFPVKPVIAVLDGKGPVNVVTGKTMTVLPAEGPRPRWPNLPNNAGSTNKSAA